MNAMVPIAPANARLPQTYEAAKLALATCESMDECKDWSDRAAALASYAKQAGDDELMKRAVRIRDRAIRRCGELLKQFDGRPENAKQSEDDLTLMSQRQAAAEAGLSVHQQRTAVRVANVPDEQFEELVESEEPPTVTKLANIGKVSRPVIDHGGRNPRDFNQAMHFKGMFRDYAEELADWNLGDVLPRLIDSDREAVRDLIARIDAIHDTIITRI